jgi:hypothetical protein
MRGASSFYEYGRLWRAGVVLTAAFVAGCGGDEKRAGEAGGPAAAGSIQARLLTDPREDSALVFATSDYAVGVQRLAFILVTKRGQVLEGGGARVSIARGGLEARPFDEVTATFEPVGPHDDSKDELGKDFELGGLFVANVSFDEPGRYSLLVEPTDGGQLQGFSVIEVKERSASPSLGTKAPPSDNPTIADAAPERITTARPPDVALLRHSIRDSLARRQPFVVVFATPAFCKTRACGPTVGVVDAVRRRIGDSVRFIHVEVYEENDPTRGVNRWMKQWKLPTEPWIFVVDETGTIRAKFEGLASVRELELAVRAIL